MVGQKVSNPKLRRQKCQNKARKGDQGLTWGNPGGPIIEGAINTPNPWKTQVRQEIKEVSIDGLELAVMKGSEPSTHPHAQSSPKPTSVEEGNAPDSCSPDEWQIRQPGWSHKTPENKKTNRPEVSKGGTTVSMQRSRADELKRRDHRFHNRGVTKIGSSTISRVDQNGTRRLRKNKALTKERIINWVANKVNSTSRKKSNETTKSSRKLSIMITIIIMMLSLLGVTNMPISKVGRLILTQPTQTRGINGTSGPR